MHLDTLLADVVAKDGVKQDKLAQYQAAQAGLDRATSELNTAATESNQARDKAVASMAERVIYRAGDGVDAIRIDGALFVQKVVDPATVDVPDDAPAPPAVPESTEANPII